MDDWINPVINGLIAVGTFATSVFTWRAAVGAAAAAKLSHEQFELTKNQYEREKNPNILPISQTIEKGPYDIDITFDCKSSILDYGSGSDVELKLINAGIGTAFSTKAELFISNLDELLSVSELKSPKNIYIGCPYMLTFQKDDEDDNIHVNVDFNEEQRSLGVTNLNFEYSSQIIHQTIIYSRDTIVFKLSDVHHILLAHTMFSHFDNESVNSIKPQFELSITYKEENQLGSLFENCEKFAISFKDFDTTVVPARAYFRTDYEHK